MVEIRKTSEENKILGLITLLARIPKNQFFGEAGPNFVGDVAGKLRKSFKKGTSVGHKLGGGGGELMLIQNTSSFLASKSLQWLDFPRC